MKNDGSKKEHLLIFKERSTHDPGSKIIKGLLKRNNWWLLHSKSVITSLDVEKVVIVI